MARPTAPAKLGSKARRMWRDITGTYDLRPDELRVLEDACREVDLIERLEEALRPDPDAGAGDDGDEHMSSLIVRGSMGQPVANPLVQELRQHRSTLQRLLASLKLPDETGKAGEGRSEAARKAAGARWQRGA